MSTPIVYQYLDMNSKPFGYWLKEQRQLRGLQQGVLEKQAGLTQGHVSRFERGILKYPTDDVRARIHAALGTTDDDLVEAGVLRAVEFEGKRVYLAPRGTQRPSSHTPTTGVITNVDAMAEIAQAASGLRWTRSMVDSMLRQVDLFKEMQGVE